VTDERFAEFAASNIYSPRDKSTVAVFGHGFMSLSHREDGTWQLIPYYYSLYGVEGMDAPREYRIKRDAMADLDEFVKYQIRHISR
jgi:hypothetical protein